MFAKTISITNTRTIRRRRRGTCLHGAPRSGCTRRAWMGKMCERSTARHNGWSDARARAKALHFWFAIPTATWGITLATSVREALAEEMRRDPRVCIFGEDVAEAGTPFKVLSGLVEEFGRERVLDTPISEAGFTGMGVGAAMTGLRPVVDIMFGDFLT